MTNKRSTSSKIGSIIFILIIIIAIIKIYDFSKKYNFNGFIKAENISGISNFKRDSDVKFSDDNSYLIESDTYNDAVFYKEIQVTPNTPYRVTCMVKTEDVQNKIANSDAGATICIVESTEISDNLVGTNEWTKLEFIFNSKNRETVKVGFRLGGNFGNTKGKVWFSDFKLEKGIPTTDTEWNIGCFIFKNVNVTLNDGKNESFIMSSQDINNAKNNIERFKNTCEELANNQMTIKYDIHEMEEAITTISYSAEHGYYVSPQDVKDIIKEKVIQNEYDHIFIVVRMGNDNVEIPVNEWIGLGSMDLYDIGFSTIRLANSSNSYTYKYDYRINTFPEEVYIHEFLHALERTLEEHNYSIVSLHSSEEYGYKDEGTVGLKRWYQDYMRKAILKSDTNEYVGLDSIVYGLKPTHRSEFNYAVELEFSKEPNNFIEEVKTFF